MSLLIVGTLAFDTIETPYERRERVLGGSATYCALAARHFTPVNLVGVVGQDFGAERLRDFQQHGIDTTGVEVAKGKTFFWAGRYEADWNTRHTLATELNVLEHFDPKVPSSYRDAKYLFLANAAPAVQRAALAQCRDAEFVMADTMNLWINIARDELLELLQRIDGLVLNDEEARMLSGERNLLDAARKVLSYGPRFCVLKKGEHGAFLIGRDVHYALPAYPVNQVLDPTGAGDSFAGGFMGYLASVQHTGSSTLKRAMLYGTVTASYCVEGFSVDRLRATTRKQVEERFNELFGIVSL
jgi:sugar/nucleoside kinase (ribokinase family)